MSYLGQCYSGGCRGSYSSLESRMGGVYMSMSRMSSQLEYMPSSSFSSPSQVYLSEILDEKPSSSSYHAYASASYLPSGHIIFNPGQFLDPRRELLPLVSNLDEIEPLVEEAMFATTGMSMPEDIVIRICAPEEFQQAFPEPERCSDAIRGFCMNNRGFGKSHIFIRRGDKAEVLLTIGHEIGHALSFPLQLHDEEAKAFAFSVAWMEQIKKRDIGGLGRSIRLGAPAENGLHNAALKFVVSLVEAGKDALAVFKGLISGEFSLSKKRQLESLITFT